MAMHQSRVLVSRDTKENRLAGKLSVNTAKTKNSGLFNRYQKARAKYFKLKEQINKMYGQKSKMSAKQIAHR